jgi:cytochrome c-type biogenesis protein CcmE
LTRKQKRLGLLLGGMASLGIATGLVLVAFKDNLVFFYSPSALLEKNPQPGRALRIGGLVEEHSVNREDGGLKISFKITDLVHEVPVVYVGVPPSLFREGQGVVAEGSLDASGVFRANTILAKHDERYMPKEVVDSLKAAGKWRGDEAEAQSASAGGTQ